MSEKRKDDATYVWAIVDSGTRRLFGRVSQVFVDRWNEAPQDSQLSCRVHEALELSNELFFIGMRKEPHAPTGVVPQFGEQPLMRPLDFEASPVTLVVLVANLRVIHEHSTERYEDYVTTYHGIVEGLRRKSAATAGIAVP